MTSPYLADDDRYDGRMPYRPSGASGLVLPAVSLGFWYNFGGVDPIERQRAVARRAFDLGVTHFDLANNYGPPPGSAEQNMGELLATDFKPYRDELVISSKAGYEMWPGPYGDGGSRKYLLGSLDQSLKRLRLDYVDIFYSHRMSPETPLEETVGALVSAVQQGKALYVGISSYTGQRTREAAQLLREAGVPLLIHQPSYSIVNRWVEADLLDVLDEIGVGCIAFSPLSQGMLTSKYLDGVPTGTRASDSEKVALSAAALTEPVVAGLRGLNEIAEGRGQTLAQMAIAWILRDSRVTSALIGARTVEQLEDSVAAVEKLTFTDSELAAIDEQTKATGLDLLAHAPRG